MSNSIWFTWKPDFLDGLDLFLLRRGPHISKFYWIWLRKRCNLEEINEHFHLVTMATRILNNFGLIKQFEKCIRFS